MKRAQPIFVIRRKADGFYHYGPKGGSPRWIDDIAQANIISRSRVTGKIRAEWGLDLDDFEVVEVAPRIFEEPEGA